MGVLYGRAGHLTALFGGFRPGQFGVDPATGRLTLLSRCSSGGLTPRHFHLDGEYLRVVNQDGADGSDGTTGCVVTFRVAADGALVEPRTQPVDGCPSRGRYSHSGTTLCISLVIRHTKYTGPVY